MLHRASCQENSSLTHDRFPNAGYRLELELLSIQFEYREIGKKTRISQLTSGPD